VAKSSGTRRPKWLLCSHGKAVDHNRGSLGHRLGLLHQDVSDAAILAVT